ncbi:MAG: hypothetical protein WAM39_31960 [Bryobacteraceae bacterium]
MVCKCFVITNLKIRSHLASHNKDGRRMRTIVAGWGREFDNKGKFLVRMMILDIESARAMPAATSFAARDRNTAKPLNTPS